MQSAPPAAPRRLPLLLLLFVGSGAAALIYEIVWFQLLQLVIGSSAVSLGVLLASFMGGMCVGSLAFARVISGKRHPLRVYALLEWGIGLAGIVLAAALPYTSAFYAWLGGESSGLAMRALLCGLVLLPPTILMGATLPAIARWVEATPQGAARLGLLYGANIAGAVAGCLLAGFYLLRVHDLATASYVAVGINLLVGAIAWTLAPRTSGRSASPTNAFDAAAPRWVYLVAALSGMAALGAEVIWTRWLSLLLGATVYSFSIILAVFLTGLGIGGAAGSLIVNRTRTHAGWLGLCQALLILAAGWAGYQLTQSLPYWPIDASLSAGPWTVFQMDFLRCAWATLPAACLWGASFPLALAAAARGGDPGKLAGNVYAANTLGAIAGALLFSMALVPAWGTAGAQIAVLAVAATAAAVALATSRRTWVGILATGGLLVLVLPWSDAVPNGLVGYGRYLPTYAELPAFLYVGEGRSASIAVSEDFTGIREFHVSGKVVASSHAADMRLQRMLGHLPALLHRKPRTVLVVGCGAGVTAGSFVVHPSIERIVICEIEPLIPAAAGKYFDIENHDVMKDPRVEVVLDDARHFLATTDENFDIITSDPIHPWVKGAAALYSREYFELTKRRLQPGGVVTQWVPLYESSEEAVQSQLVTFFEAFPHGTVWGNEDSGKGYDVVMLGTGEGAIVDIEQLRARLAPETNPLLRASLAEVGLADPTALLATYAGNGPGLAAWLDKRYLNTDANLRLQYLAGFGLNQYQAAGIYREMLNYRTYPEQLFGHAGESEAALRRQLEP